MKYIKLFEELESDLPTLRDVVDNNPDDFEDFERAALETVDALDLKLDPDEQRLRELGLIDKYELFDRVKLVFNIDDVPHTDVPRLRALVQKFPGLFTVWYGELIASREAVPDKEIDPKVGQYPFKWSGSKILYDEVDVTVWKDSAGNTAVYWESLHIRMWFMLGSAL
jgi:hypothetical protein